VLRIIKETEDQLDELHQGRSSWRCQNAAPVAVDSILHQGPRMGRERVPAGSGQSQSKFLETNRRGSSSKRTKHMIVRYFFIANRVASGEVRIEYCPTAQMIANFFTKPLQGALFRFFCSQILILQDVLEEPVPRDHRRVLKQLPMKPVPSAAPSAMRRAGNGAAGVTARKATTQARATKIEHSKAVSWKTADSRGKHK
jgi:hypothetical protein